MKITFRLLEILFIVLKHRSYFLLSYLKLPFASFFQKPLNKKQAESIVKIFEDLGPVYIKLGQFLSSRSDILGNTLANELKNLQDKVNKPLNINIKKHLENEFNIKFKDHFSEISQTAVACASVASVYKATTLKGEEVAIKVLNNNLSTVIKKDLPLLKLILKFALSKENLNANRLEDIINFIEKHFTFETDLRFEAACIEEFSETYKNTPKLVLPEIIWQYSNKNVLTTKWIDGYKINQLPENFNKKQIADDFVRIFILQVLSKGFFHGDMHEGNIIVDKKGNICLIDFGIVGRLDENSKYYLARIFYGLLNKNYKDAAKAHIQAGYVSKKHNVDEFALACRAIASKLLKQKQEDISISSLLTQLFEITKIFEMKVQTHLILLQKSMVLVENVTKSLCPTVNVWLLAKHHVKEIFEENNKLELKIQASYVTTKELLEKVDKIGDSIINISVNLNNNKIKSKKNFNTMLKVVALTIFSIFIYHNLIR